MGGVVLSYELRVVLALTLPLTLPLALFLNSELRVTSSVTPLQGTSRLEAPVAPPQRTREVR